MKINISEKSVEAIHNFARKYGGREPVFDDLKVMIPISKFSVTFLQIERSSKLINCYFDFGMEIGFFFEDVRLAVEGSADDCNEVVDENLSDVDVIARNDKYVHGVLVYCERNIKIITSMPPSWFPRATEIADAATRKNFPDLADEDLRKKQELWKSWQM